MSQELHSSSSYHYFAIANFGRHTHHAVRILFAKVFGESSLVTFLTNIGDAGILFRLYFVECLLEESYSLLSIVSRFLGQLGEVCESTYSSAPLRETTKPKPFSVLKLYSIVKISPSGVCEGYPNLDGPELTAFVRQRNVWDTVLLTDLVTN